MVRTASIRTGQNQKGLALLEMALVLPLLMLLLLGVIEYGWMFLKAQQITNAARQGCRVGATADGTDSAVEAAIDQVMNLANLAGSGYTTTINPGTAIAPGETLTVTVSVPYSNISLLDTSFIPTPANLRSSTSLAKEGP